MANLWRLGRPAGVRRKAGSPIGDAQAGNTSMASRRTLCCSAALFSSSRSERADAAAAARQARRATCAIRSPVRRASRGQKGEQLFAAGAAGQAAAIRCLCLCAAAVFVFAGRLCLGLCSRLATASRPADVAPLSAAERRSSAPPRGREKHVPHLGLHLDNTFTHT
jgi:hypothetical protein